MVSADVALEVEVWFCSACRQAESDWRLPSELNNDSPTLIWDYSGCPVQGFNAELSLDPAMVDAEYSADLGPGARSARSRR